MATSVRRATGRMRSDLIGLVLRGPQLGRFRRFLPLIGSIVEPEDVARFARVRLDGEIVYVWDPWDKTGHTIGAAGSVYEL